MKVLTAIVLFLLAVTVNAQETVYGAGITLEEKTNVSDILSNPENYLGKKVLVEGRVLEVCQHAGCWMEIAGSALDEKIKVKVKDGEIVFPVEAAGRIAVVEGEVYSIELDQEEAIEFYQHFAEDAGKDFDPSTVTGPVTIYQIKGLGAVIDFSNDLPDVNHD